MTREQAIEVLKGFVLYAENVRAIQYRGSVTLPVEALNIAIEALEREPSEDCISRQDTIRYIEILLDMSYEKSMIYVDRKELQDKLIKAINKQKTVKPKTEKWIPVSERLPEEGLTVLIYTESGDVEIGRRDGNEWEWLAESIADFWTRNDYVTAWQPLPEPYEEGNK